ncbi:5'/3'-nucleotidase SurE [Tundrisphaera lichenicola]|uniref:5'/3'-nucleotidase SurE n=1 Tax=Tundrisphaera lichenicola TaxID=2029860 RepID=UPI003EB6BDF8
MPSNEPTPSIIVLTNDDGVDTPGLSALIDSTRHLSHRRVMAPLGPQSGCGHVVTTHEPIAMVERPDGQIGVDGTPADCVRLAIHRFGPAIGWVISGINAGGNLGADIHHSGTVAAVREAALHGIPGIAVSHYIARGRAIDWDRAARWFTPVLDQLMGRPPEPGTFWNVNLPHPEPGGSDPPVIFCPVDTSPLPLAYREEDRGLKYSGDYQARARVESGDVAICFGGQIAVSKVHVMASVWPLD